MPGAWEGHVKILSTCLPPCILQNLFHQLDMMEEATLFNLNTDLAYCSLFFHSFFFLLERSFNVKHFHLCSVADKLTPRKICLCTSIWNSFHISFFYISSKNTSEILITWKHLSYFKKFVDTYKLLPYEVRLKYVFTLRKKWNDTGNRLKWKKQILNNNKSIKTLWEIINRLSISL